MRTNHRLGVVLLALVLVLFAGNLPASAQRITAGGATPTNKKDQNKDDDDKDGKNRGNKGGSQSSQNSGQSGNQSSNPTNSKNQGSNAINFQGQGNANNQGANSNTGNANRRPSSSQQLQQLLQQRRDSQRNDNDDDRDRNRDRDRDRDRDDDDRGPNFGPGDKAVFPGQPGFNYKLPNGTIRLPNPPAASPANKKLGHWQDDKWQGTQKADNWVQVFGGRDKPFSPQWYRDHPQAWRYDNNRWNVWIGASVPGVYSWLGWGQAPREYSIGIGPERFDPSRWGEWYPLGVFSLQTGPDDIGTRVVQLAVDRRGNVTGNYFDMITNVNHNITGGVDRESQRVMWWLNRNPSIQFHSRIYRLLRPYGSIYVELPGGDQRWQFVRLEN